MARAEGDLVPDALVARLDSHVEKVAAGIGEDPDGLLVDEVGPRLGQEGEMVAAPVAVAELPQALLVEGAPSSPLRIPSAHPAS